MIARALRQLAILLLVALVPATVSGVIQLKRTGTRPLSDEVDVATVRGWGVEVVWVDARTQAKYDRGHIEGALLLNEDEWDRLVPAFLDAWEPEKHVVVYCDGGSCDASHAVARRLRDDLKLENVSVLKGGIAAWRPR